MSSKVYDPRVKSLQAPPPNDAQYRAGVSERLQALLGLDPREALDKLRDAQKITSDLRREESRQKALLASYEARFGFPSHWDCERKALLSRLSEHERNRVAMLGKKISEGALDDYSHAHGEYTSFLAASFKERLEMERLRAEVARLEGEIETARAAEVFYEKHARLNEALVYHSSREMGL